MARADKAEHCHARSARGDDSRDAVLDHEAISRLDAHPKRRMQKKIRTWFSFRDLGGGENVGREQGLIAGHAKRQAYSLRPTGGGDAHASPQTFDRLPHAFDPLQLAREGRKNLARKILTKSLGQWRPEFGFDSE